LSLLLAAVAAAALCASAGGGYLFASFRKPKPEKDGSDEKEKGKGKSKGAPPPEKRQRDDEKRDDGKRDFEVLPLTLGDVVIAEGEERWLAGGLLAREGDRVVAAVFFAPEGARTKVVVAFARPRRDIFWLSPARVDSPAEPPAACEIDGSPMTRRARLPVTLTRHGQGVPALGNDGILAEYDGGADEIAVLLTSEGRAFAWRGRKLEHGDYDRLGSGGEDGA
jgi:hypothetical protein